MTIRSCRHKTLLSRIEGGFLLKKTLNPAGDRSRLRQCKSLLRQDRVTGAESTFVMAKSGRMDSVVQES